MFLRVERVFWYFRVHDCYVDLNGRNPEHGECSVPSASKMVYREQEAEGECFWNYFLLTWCDKNGSCVIPYTPFSGRKEEITSDGSGCTYLSFVPIDRVVLDDDFRICTPQNRKIVTIFSNGHLMLDVLGNREFVADVPVC